MWAGPYTGSLLVPPRTSERGFQRGGQRGHSGATARSKSTGLKENIIRLLVGLGKLRPGDAARGMCRTSRASSRSASSPSALPFPPFSDTYEVTASGEMLLTRSASALGDFEDQRETGGVAGLHRGVAGG